MVTFLNSSWNVVDHLYHVFLAVIVELGALGQRVWLLFILRTDLGRQEGLSEETLSDISNHQECSSVSHRSTHPGRDLGGARGLTTTFLLRLACVTLGSLWEACLKCVRGRIKRLQKRTRKPLLAFLWPEPLEPWKQENILFPLGLPDK